MIKMMMDYTKTTVTGRLESALELSHTTPSEAIYKGISGGVCCL